MQLCSWIEWFPSCTVTKHWITISAVAETENKSTGFCFVFALFLFCMIFFPHDRWFFYMSFAATPRFMLWFILHVWLEDLQLQSHAVCEPAVTVEVIWQRYAYWNLFTLRVIFCLLLVSQLSLALAIQPQTCLLEENSRSQIVRRSKASGCKAFDTYKITSVTFVLRALTDNCPGNGPVM